MAEDASASQRIPLIEAFLDLSPTEQDDVRRFIRDLRSGARQGLTFEELEEKYRRERELEDGGDS